MLAGLKLTGYLSVFALTTSCATNTQDGANVTRSSRDPITAEELASHQGAKHPSSSSSTTYAWVVSTSCGTFRWIE